MRDGPVRRGLKRLALASFVVDVRVARAWRRLRGERPHRLGGDCRRCARCCEAPGIQVGRLTWYVPMLRRAFLAWQRRVNGFEPTGRDVGSRTFVFRCTHFDTESRSCDSYDSRPGMCRDYPRALLWQPHPELLPGCGYRPVAANAAALKRALEGRPLTPEQRERLERELRLEE
jgi:Fe-S-cluster containining protein